MLALLKIDPKERPSIEQILDHPYFSKSIDVSPDDQKLREVCSDLIKRVNVFKLEDRQHLLDHLSEKLAPID